MTKPTASPDNMTSITEIIQWSATRDHNEADTRHKVIDTVLHEFLAWPKNRVATEEYIRPGFADYILKKANGDDLIFIEAKRDGVFFEIPVAATAADVSGYISIQNYYPIRTLMKLWGRFEDTALIQDANTLVLQMVSNGCFSKLSRKQNAGKRFPPS